MSKKLKEQQKEREKKENEENTFKMLKEILSINRYPKLYQVLECETDASPSTIREQYRALSLKHHPDRGGSSSKMSKINQAYDILSDNDKRHIYDTLGSNYFIDEINEYLKIPRVLINYIPIIVNSFIDKKLNLKDTILSSAAIGGRDDKVINRLGYYHLIGFPLVHYFVDNKISNFLQYRYGVIGSRSNNKKFRVLSEYINFNGIISEILATFLTAPFEIAAFRAYIGGCSISKLNTFFTFIKDIDSNANNLVKTTKKSDESELLSTPPPPPPPPPTPTPTKTTWLQSLNPFSQVIPNIKGYLMIFKRDWKFVVGMVGFRVALSCLIDLISYFSDYFHHKYLETYHLIDENEKYRNIFIEKYIKEQQLKQKQLQHSNGNGSGQQVDEIDNQELLLNNGYLEYEKEIKKLYSKARFYLFASKVARVASYAIPFYFFQIHRLFYVFEDTQRNLTWKDYFSADLLKVGLLEAMVHYVFQQTNSLIQSTIFGANVLIKDVLHLIYKSTNNIDDNNNNNSDNNNNNNSNKKNK